MKCFQVFHHFAPKCRKSVNNAEISRFRICHWAARKTLVKSLFSKENVLISVSLGSWKFYYFQQKINKQFSEQKQMANCNRSAQKVWKMWSFKKLWECFFFGGKKTKEREEGERGGRQEQQRERREQKSKARPYTRPNSWSPASGGNYWYYIILHYITLHYII